MARFTHPAFGDIGGLTTETKTWTPTFSGTGLTYTGTPTTGHYIQLVKLIHFYIYVSMSTVTNFGSGQYHLTLPIASAYHYAFRDGGIHHPAQNYHFQLMADAEPNSTDLELYYTASNGLDGAVDHNSPHVLETGDFFYLTGTYISI